MRLVAGLTHKREAKNATLLRGLLKRVCSLPSVRLGYTVELDGPSGGYQVHLTKEKKVLRRPKKAKSK